MKTVLHWLPYPARSQFRILHAVALCLIGEAPPYLSELLHPLSSISGRPFLRSMAQGLLSVPRARTSLFQKHGFASVGPTMWNDLDSSIRKLATADSMTFFLKRMKTFLFTNLQ